MNKLSDSKGEFLPQFENEEWREIIGKNGEYYISSYGRVKSFRVNKKTGKILRLSQVNGFAVITMKINDKPTTQLVHKLVAGAFVPKPSPDCTHVIHMDWNIKNNHYTNLQWVTRKENYERILPKLHEINRLNPSRAVTHAKLKLEDVKVLKSMLQRGIKQSIIAKAFCISEMQVTRIKRGENWGNVQQDNT